jgi:class 3 adenylate cyclase
MAKQPLQIECLVLAQTFEMLWAYYTQSGRQLYPDECRSAALQFIEAYEELSQIDDRVLDANSLKLGKNTDIADIIWHLKKWGEGRTAYPYVDANMSKRMLHAFFTGLKGLMLRDLGVSRWPTMIYSSAEHDHSARIVRWRGHLPRAALLNDPDLILSAASDSTTIALVGDIRRSQDLMTYAQEPTDFSRRMVQFITTTRKLIEKHGGLFDKFTGDGFIVYFNSAVCSAARLNHIDSFLGFLKDELDFAIPLFNEWSRSIRKRPAANIGLAMGADVGRVNFEDIHDHLVAVGDTIVWAARMASVALSNEVLVNNLLHAALEGRKGLTFQEREGQTKAGETFFAQSLSFNRGGDDA